MGRETNFKLNKLFIYIVAWTQRRFLLWNNTPALNTIRTQPIILLRNCHEAKKKFLMWFTFFYLQFMNNWLTKQIAFCIGNKKRGTPPPFTLTMKTGWLLLTNLLATKPTLSLILKNKLALKMFKIRMIVFKLNAPCWSGKRNIKIFTSW